MWRLPVVLDCAHSRDQGPLPQACCPGLPEKHGHLGQTAGAWGSGGLACASSRSAYSPPPCFLHTRTHTCIHCVCFILLYWMQAWACSGLQIKAHLVHPIHKYIGLLYNSKKSRTVLDNKMTTSLCIFEAASLNKSKCRKAECCCHSLTGDPSFTPSPSIKWVTHTQLWLDCS